MKHVINVIGSTGSIGSYLFSRLRLSPSALPVPPTPLPPPALGRFVSVNGSEPAKLESYGAGDGRRGGCKSDQRGGKNAHTVVAVKSGECRRFIEDHLIGERGGGGGGGGGGAFIVCNGMFKICKELDRKFNFSSVKGGSGDSGRKIAVTVTNFGARKIHDRIDEGGVRSVAVERVFGGKDFGGRERDESMIDVFGLEMTVTDVVKFYTSGGRVDELGLSLRGSPRFENTPLHQSLSSASVSVRIVSSLREMYRISCMKLYANCVVNASTAIFDVLNGQAVEAMKAVDIEVDSGAKRPLIDVVVDDIVKFNNFVLNPTAPLTARELLSHVEGVCSRTSGNVSSMLSDVRSGRRTEIDEICGFVEEEGRENGLELEGITWMKRNVEDISREGRER